MKRVDPAVVAIAVMFGVGALVGGGALAKAVVGFRDRQARLAHSDDAVRPEPVVVPSAPSEPLPVDEEKLRAARARLGEISNWSASVDPCPRPLPSFEASIARRPPDAFGIREVHAAEPPFPVRITREPDRALVLLNEPVTEPTVVLLRSEWEPPHLDNRRLFTPPHSPPGLIGSWRNVCQRKLEMSGFALSRNVRFRAQHRAPGAPAASSL